MKNQTILIIDDEEHDVEFIKRGFERAGVVGPVRAVANGEEAVQYLLGQDRFANRAEFPFPRLMVTDLKMPRMGGIELLKWLRANSPYRNVPTVVLTSSNTPCDVEAAFANGAVGYMVKPVAFQQLEQTVKVIADYWQLSLLPACVATQGASAA